MIYLSIIVPVYNTPIEKLETCFQSINNFIELNNELNAECIIIDDGSKESISTWCKNFIAKKSCFKFYKKENEGVSVARNLGIEKSNGKYITFVDSDDILLTVDGLSQKLISQKFDLLFTDLITDKQQSWKAFNGDSREIEIREVIEKIVSDGKLNGPYCKFIKGDLVKKIKIQFDRTMITGEDLVFFMKVLMQKPRMSYLAQISYVYNLDEFTSNNRLKKNPDVFIANNTIMYKTMIDVVENSLSLEKQLEYKTNAAVRFIKQLFNSAAELSNMGLLSLNRKETIRLLVLDLDTRIINAIKNRRFSKSAIQLTIIMHNKWLLLTVIGKIRSLYLSLKSNKM